MTLSDAFIERFWRRVDRGAPDDCWPWTGYTLPKGYGSLSCKALRVSPVAAHRIAWMLTHGDPGDACVLHRCDNPPCCNPAHLFLGDIAINNADMRAKGRAVAPPNRWAEVTSCPKGHPWTPENRIPNGEGKTRCAPCKRESNGRRVQINGVRRIQAQ